MNQDKDDGVGGNTLAGLLTIAIAIALFYFNGWRFDATSYLKDVTGLGLFADTYRGAPALFVRIDGHWYGVSRTNLDALLFDAPLINFMALIASVPALFSGIRAFVWPETLSTTSNNVSIKETADER